MEMKVRNDVFYLLDTGNEKWLYESEGDAIEALKRLVGEKKELDPEEMAILEVNTSREDWQITSVPWSKIAVGLMKGGKRE